MRGGFIMPVIAILVMYTMASAVEIEFGEKGLLKIHGYGQVRLEASAEKEYEFYPDFYARKFRLMLFGQLNERIKFFFGTLSLNIGKGGKFNAPAINMADVWAEYDFAEGFKINAGWMTVPFSHHMAEAGSKTHGMDYHAAFLHRKGGSSHRDIGVMARGVLFNNRLDYRIAILDGVEIVNEERERDKNFRYCGRIAVNIFDAEPDFWWRGTYLGQKKILSFGASYDLEPNVREDWGMYYAFAADALADIPIGDNGLTSTVSAYFFGPDGAVPEGWGLWADFGYRIKKVEPIIAVEYYSPKEGDTGKLTSVLGGINWWLKGFDANFKLEVGVTQADGVNDWSKRVTLQNQIFF